MLYCFHSALSPFTARLTPILNADTSSALSWDSTEKVGLAVTLMIFSGDAEFESQPEHRLS